MEVAHKMAQANTSARGTMAPTKLIAKGVLDIQIS
jgi:hypothetical protein